MTLFDHAVLAISGFSVLFGLMRGFTREVISLASWAVAFVVASAYGGSAATQFTTQVADDNWRALVGFVVVFLVTLIAMNIVALLASKLIKSAGLGVEDRLLGALFGFGRGLLVVLALVLVAGLTPLPRQPVWKNAMLAAPLESLAMMVGQWLPRDWAKFIQYE